MPVRVLSQEAGPSSKIPAHLTRIPISAISISSDCSNRSIQGKVVHKGPLVSRAADDFISKIVIQEEGSDPNGSSQNVSINVVLLGTLAKDFSQAVNQGDVVEASGFTVGKSPTVHKDKLHPCNLLLSDHSWIYVSQVSPPANLRPSVANRSTSVPSEVSRSKLPKYTYTGLDELKAGTVVNVYGVVVFFKQPFKSRGTDYCSCLKITDQSNQKISCNVFCENLEDHPKIFQIGDIVRLHRVKTKFFNDTITLINTFGFSAVTFDGVAGGAMEPRTSSRSFKFDQDDHRRVEELRSWAAGQTLLPPPPSLSLSAVQPRAYFDLTCQLLAKAPIDSTCTLLRVWDGTRCPRTLLKVMVEPGVTEGPSSFSAQKEKLIANVLVYDNHVEFARQLKPGDFLRIYNLRAIPASSKIPGLTSSQAEEMDHLAFHLHGGTAYGRGIRVLPEDSSDVQKLKSVLQAFSDDNSSDVSEPSDAELLDVWCTPPQSPGEIVNAARRTERSSSHDLRPRTLSELKRSGPGPAHRVRVQLRSYEPRRLHQALKLYCSKCMMLLNIPDDELLANLFSEASQDSGPCSTPPRMLSGEVDVPGDSPGSDRTLGVHLSSQLLFEGKTKELIFLRGSTLEETCRLAAGYQNVIPVKASGGHMTLLDLTAPFLFRGRKRYYGCKTCSKVVLREPSADADQLMDEKVVAEALGVQLLQFVLLMKFEVQDASDTLDVFLYRDAEMFFGVSAEDAAANQDAQTSIQQTMDMLCPPGGSMGERPWLDLCLTSYRAKDDKGQNQTCFQICHSTVNTLPHPGSEPAST